MVDQSIVREEQFVNGLDVVEYDKIVDAVRGEPKLAKFQFRVRNRWQDAGLNRSTIGPFYGAGGEQGVENRRFRVDAGEPPVLLGKDEAPNPAEYLLHALAACLTSAIVYKAAARGIVVDSLEASLEGDMDAHKFLELRDSGRTGYQGIRAAFKIKADASAEELKQLAEYSPVLDTVTRGTSVALRIEKV